MKIKKVNILKLINIKSVAKKKLSNMNRTKCSYI